MYTNLTPEEQEFQDFLTSYFDEETLLALRDLALGVEPCKLVELSEETKRRIMDKVLEDIKEKEKSIMECIQVYHRADDGMWGQSPGPDIDEQASYACYEEMVTCALRKAYPGVDIDVRVSNNVSECTHVDGMGDHDEVPWIQQIYEKIWREFDWVVYRDNLP